MENKETYRKAFIYLNNIFENLENERDINNSWQGLVKHMNVDGTKARNLLVVWKNANNFDF